MPKCIPLSIDYVINQLKKNNPILLKIIKDNNLTKKKCLEVLKYWKEVERFKYMPCEEHEIEKDGSCSGIPK